MPMGFIWSKYLTERINPYSLKNLWFSNYLNPLTKTLARKPAFFYRQPQPSRWEGDQCTTPDYLRILNTDGLFIIFFDVRSNGEKVTIELIS
jgi:hypothetical protein